MNVIIESIKKWKAFQKTLDTLGKMIKNEYTV